MKTNEELLVKFTSPSTSDISNVTVWLMDDISGIYLKVTNSFNHTKDFEIKKTLVKQGWNLTNCRGNEYTIRGGDINSLQMLQTDLAFAYGIE